MTNETIIDSTDDDSDKKKTKGNRRVTRIDTDTANIRSNKTKVFNLPEPPIRTVVNNPLTKEQRAIIKDLVNEFVNTSLLANRYTNHARVYSMLYRDGLEGKVNGIEQIDQNEFETCCSFLKKGIVIKENQGNSKVMRMKPGWQHRAKQHIQIRKKQEIEKGNLTEEKWNDFMIGRYGEKSTTKLDQDDLADLSKYLKMKAPKFTLSKEKQKVLTQQKREHVLSVLLIVMAAEAKAAGKEFYINSLNCTRNEMFEKLKKRDSDLFGTLSESTFYEFWKVQKLCDCVSGRRSGSGSQ